jgi:lysophospholipase L1-like esterase
MPMQVTRRVLMLGLAGMALSGAACRKASVRATAVPAGASVLALGDSLTHGSGAAPGSSYPAVLQQMTGWQVVNAGVPGDTASQALARLPDLLQQHAPKLVLVSIGGNDLLRRLPEAALRADLRRICELSLAAGAQVLLVAVPRPSAAAVFIGSLTDHTLYAQLAEELGLPLQRQGWAEVLSDERLRADRIHANAEGYRQFAGQLAATARAVGLLAGAR